MFAQKPQLRIKPTRSAFSLVELLVVMAIIGILAGLSFVLLGQSGKAAREASTKTGIQIIQTILDERIRGFENITQSMTLADPDLPQRPELREFRKRVQEFVIRYNGAGNTPAQNAIVPPQIAEIFIRKYLFKAAFPQREEDLWGMDGISDFETSPNSYVDDSPLLSRMWDSTNNNWIVGSWKQQDQAARTAAPTNLTDDDLAESAELLYLALTQADVFGLTPGSLDGLDQKLIGDTDGDDNPELLDGWGRPLQFYNFPTRLFKANGTAYTTSDYRNASALVASIPADSAPVAQRAMMNRDPGDNASQLSRMRDTQSQPRWLTTNFNMTNLSALATPRQARAFSSVWYHDRDCYHIPMIISGGPDEQLGISLPNDTASSESHLGLVTNSDELFDNITNRQKGPQ